MNFNFGEVLSRAWQITWRHKVLWLAGIALSLISLLSAPISLIFNPAFSDPSDLNRQLPTLFLANGLIILIGILSIPISVIAMSLPSLATVQLENGSQELKFGELLKGILPYFWRILGVFLLVWVGTMVVMLAIFACTMLLSVLTFGLASMCTFVIFIPFILLVFALMEQGMAAVIVDRLGVTAALQTAWGLVKGKPGVMALMGIIIYAGSMIVGMILAIPMLIPMFGFMTSTIQSMGAEPDLQAFQALSRNMMWWMLAFSPIYAVLQGILFTFMQSAWTLTYMRLTRSPQVQVLPQEATV